MHPFKRGFIEKCAEYGLSKDQAKTLYKSAGWEDAWKQVTDFATKNQDQLIHAGVGAGLGGLTGMGLAGQGNRGTGFGLGALAGGLGGWYGSPYIKDIQSGIRGHGQAGRDYIENRPKIQETIDNAHRATQDYANVRQTVSSMNPLNWNWLGKNNSNPATNPHMIRTGY
jgi:hypothetical protein